MFEGSYFLFSLEKGIGILTLNRPPYNIFEAGFYVELGEVEDFIVKQETHGTGTQSHEGSGGGGMTKEDIMKIKDDTERQRAIAENHELFGF